MCNIEHVKTTKSNKKIIEKHQFFFLRKHQLFIEKLYI